MATTTTPGDSGPIGDDSFTEEMIAGYEQKQRRATLYGFGRALLPFIFLLAVWWGVYEIFDPAPTKLVNPAKVLDAFFEVMREGTLPAYEVMKEILMMRIDYFM